MTTLHLLISGRVQGVGFRDWMLREAARHGVSGWVRNSGAAQVEAVIQGDPAAVAAILAACRIGPPYGQVTQVETAPHPPLDRSGFMRLPSVRTR